jgi:methionyl-tRNA formyltransferase
MIPAYVVASCKSWHKVNYDRISTAYVGDWHWVESPEQLLECVRRVQPKYVFFLHWNWIVPAEIWAEYECVCFHMTDVPYGRGGSPLQNLILAGHSQTKLTALRMVGEVDAGPIYLKQPLSLAGTAQEIYLRAGELSFEMIRKIVDAEPVPQAQRGEPTFFKRRKPDQSHLPTNSDPKAIYDFIRMLDADGYPHAYIEYGNMRFEFSSAKLSADGVSASVNILFKSEE